MSSAAEPPALALGPVVVSQRPVVTNRGRGQRMAMLHIHAYPCRPPEDIELLVNPGRRGHISRRVVRSLRDHVASPFVPPPASAAQL